VNREQVDWRCPWTGNTCRSVILHQGINTRT